MLGCTLISWIAERAGVFASFQNGIELKNLLSKFFFHNFESSLITEILNNWHYWDPVDNIVE